MGKRSTALKLLVDEEQEIPHEIMRFVAMGDELVLQSKLENNWEHIYRVVFLPRVDAEYKICNWFTATHPQVHRNSSTEPTSQQPDRGASRTKQNATDPIQLAI